MRKTLCFACSGLPFSIHSKEAATLVLQLIKCYKSIFGIINKEIICPNYLGFHALVSLYKTFLLKILFYGYKKHTVTKVKNDCLSIIYI